MADYFISISEGPEVQEYSVPYGGIYCKCKRCSSVFAVDFVSFLEPKLNELCPNCVEEQLKAQQKLEMADRLTEIFGMPVTEDDIDSIVMAFKKQYIYSTNDAYKFLTGGTVPGNLQDGKTMWIDSEDRIHVTQLPFGLIKGYI